VDKVSRALAAKGFEFDPKAPTTLLMEDPATGALREDVLGERVICAIVEGKSPAERLPDLLQALSEVAKEIDTVFSLDMMTMAGEDGSVPTVETARGLGYAIRPNAKASLGMGRHCPARQG
jgi:hypothetical protein